jgi:MOSC domain-containing protein YiiM
VIAPANIRVVRLFTSAGHNFFDHHGQAAGNSPRVEHREVRCVAGRGIEGDRFFSYKTDYKGQITFFSSEVFEQVCRELGVTGKDAGLTRRNVITAGVDLNLLVGAEFTIQGIRFDGVEECRPCHWMDEAIAPGAEAALRSRGGLRARILTSGMLRVDA